MENYDNVNWDSERAIEQALTSGVTFNVAYVGYIEIKMSVKALDRDLRTATACECIMRMNDWVNKKKFNKKRIDKKIKDFVSDTLDTQYTGSRVMFSISSERFEIRIMKHDEILAKHDVSNISFAAIGESDLSNYIGYVGKDALNFRACYILDCGPIRARRIIKAIHTVFQMRCKKFINDDSRRITTYRRVRPAAPAQSVKAAPVVRAEPNHYERLQPPVPGRNDAPLPRLQLQNELWFHGAISRHEAEDLLRFPGDFLIRESTSVNEIILSCFNGNHMHISLTDGDGKVRTTNKVFESIHDLVEYHSNNNAPIIAPNNCSLFLTQPITSESSAQYC